jgi:DNA-binding transcriptional MerR regulator
MSSRSYLSIGDVLTLLRQEFPDVTISKIRFLESQGLVNPERTPSGYRKFYEHDVERLRWVLRQQREHFLPLKVIKDRLDDDPEGSDPTGSLAAATPGTPASAEAATRNSASAGGNHSDEPVLVGQRVSADAPAAKAADVSTGPSARSAGGPMLPGIETSYSAAPNPAGSKSAAGAGGSQPNVPAAPAAPSAAPSTPRLDVSERTSASGPSTVPASEPAAEPAASTAAGTASDTAHDAPSAGTSAGKGAPASDAPGPTGGPTRPRRAKTTSGGHGGGAPAGEPEAHVAAEPASAGAAAPGRPAPAGLDEARMSVEELSASCGLEVSVLLELQEFGLLSSTVVAGLEYFDQDALAVATVAAQFAQFGIEPRHLRLYKNAADREAGFVEQIVLPLVRQRNPEARARAHEMVDELSRLGHQLRGALLRNALSDLLNG